MTLTLEEMARRDLDNALRMGRTFDQMFATLIDPQPAKAPVIQTITIRTIDGGNGKRIASNIYGANGINHTNQWGWIVDAVKEHFGCDEDDVECVETEDGDMIAVCGKIVAFTEIE